MFPEDVRQGLIAESDDPGVRAATAEKGAALHEATIDALVEHVTGIAEGRIPAEIDGL
jgi:hypothetical protein